MKITFKGSPINTIANLPAKGTTAPDFTLVKTDLSNIKLKDLIGKNIVLNIFVSIDTSVCASSARKFNEALSKMKDTVVLCVSMDLPFALQRFCAAEGLKNIIPVSAFRSPDFGKNYGVTIIDSALANLLSRAIVVIDANQKVIYTEQVSEMTEEPNYEAVIALFNKN
jgi:thiol peroxidase